MIQYLLFAWESFEAQGGINDMCGSYNTIEEAINQFELNKYKTGYDRYHIVSSQTMEIVWKN